MSDEYSSVIIGKHRCGCIAAMNWVDTPENKAFYLQQGYIVSVLPRDEADKLRPELGKKCEHSESQKSGIQMRSWDTPKTPWEQWQELKRETLSKIKDIDNATPWSEIEPKWWHEMMNVSAAIQDSKL